MDKLNIIWMTDNKDTVFHMLVVYALNAINQGWWKKINIIMWGASVKLATDQQTREHIKDMIENGITVEACRNCTDDFAVTNILERLGVSVRYIGKDLTEYIKSDEKVISI